MNLVSAFLNLFTEKRSTWRCLKTAENIIIAHEAQLLNYLRATSLEVGLILNFGPKAQVRRLLFDNDRKQVKVHRVGGST
jgi:hypothetical protein